MRPKGLMMPLLRQGTSGASEIYLNVESEKCNEAVSQVARPYSRMFIRRHSEAAEHHEDTL
jgi:hypothetical protein